MLIICTPERKGDRPPLSTTNSRVGVCGVYHPDMGGFDQVRPLANPDLVTMQLEVQKLLTEDRQPNDLILLHFSGHAVTDDSGQLYFATPPPNLAKPQARSLPPLLFPLASFKAA